MNRRSTSSRAAARRLGVSTSVLAWVSDAAARRHQPGSGRIARSTAHAIRRWKPGEVRHHEAPFEEDRRLSPPRPSHSRSRPRGLRQAAPATAAAAATRRRLVQDGQTITFLPKQLEQPVLRHQRRRRQEGRRGVRRASTSRSARRTPARTPQAQYINTLSRSSGPRDRDLRQRPQGARDSLKQARDAGIKVVTFDSDTKPGLPRPVHQPGHHRGHRQGPGRHDRRADRRRGRDRHPLGDAERDQPERLDRGHEERAASQSTRSSSWSRPRTATTTTRSPSRRPQGLLQTYPNLKGIISPTTVGIAAAARYLSSSSYKGKVMLTGLGTPDQMRKYVKDGTVKEFALWNPDDLGYLAAYAAHALVNGRDHRQGRRQVQGRQAGRVHRRRRRRGRAR